jgi:hypothetical protein
MSLSRRQLLGYAGAAGLGALVGGSSSVLGAGQALAAAGTTRFPGDPGRGRLYYGCSMPYYMDSDAWESWLGRPVTTHRHYHNADEIADLVAKVQDDREVGRRSHASIKPPGTWAAVAGGTYDGWLRQLLQQIAAVGRPVFLTIHHEPENDAGGTGMRPRHWVAMQERAIRKAATLAPKVTITPVLMQWTFDPDSGRNPRNWMVPSAKVFGFDVYNSWSPTNGKRWSTFAEKVERLRPWADGRPLVVGEYGCREDPNDPERAAVWMRDAFEYAIGHNVVSMSYFNSRQNSPDGSWELYGRRAEVFRELLARPEVVRP